jgi:hypothetical protein
LPEDEQTSKHGGAARYNAILEFKGEKIKNKKRERERKKKKKYRECIKKKREKI